jgi:adenosylcobinamide kinase/adenosylcobinamide-phosphate guanylyltransferase
MTSWTKLPSPILILGGAHAGKSELATQLIAPDRGAVVIGTADTGEGALSPRLKALKALRPPAWDTVETTHDLPAALSQAAKTSPQVLVDAVSLWLASLHVELGARGADDPVVAMADADQRINELIKVIAGVPAGCRLVLVSAEAGHGLAPQRVADRLYRRAVGLANQQLAKRAATVIEVTAGIPRFLKGGA